MPVENEPALVRFDAGAAVDLARERAGDNLLVAAEFTADGFNVIYIGDEMVEIYGSEVGVWDVGKTVHGYIHLDFEERRLFEEMYPTVEETTAFVTHTDFGRMARVVTGDEGLYLTFRPGSEISRLVDEMAEIAREG